MRLNLYLIHAYGTKKYTKAVVAADSARQAVQCHPDGEHLWSAEKGAWINRDRVPCDPKKNGWVEDPAKVHWRQLGVTSDGTTLRGVIVAETRPPTARRTSQ